LTKDLFKKLKSLTTNISFSSAIMMRIEVETEHHPRLTAWHVRQVLKWISPVDLEGIGSIRIMDESLDDPEAKQPAYLRGTTTDGRYVLRNGVTPPYILIYTRPLYLGIPSIFKLTPVATLRVASIIAHEVGHHLIVKRGYIYEPTEQSRFKSFKKHDEYVEAMCNNYALEVIKRMSDNWYYNLGNWLRRKLSNLYYLYGEIDWDKHDYKRAAHYWFCAYLLNKDNPKAIRGYLHAVAKLKPAHAQTSKPTPQTTPRRGTHRASL
jgi:hypothetical protein